MPNNFGGDQNDPEYDPRTSKKSRASPKKVHASRKYLELNDEELLVALKNVGCFIETCGACAETFYTGSTSFEHECFGLTPEQRADVKRAVEWAVEEFLCVPLQEIQDETALFLTGCAMGYMANNGKKPANKDAIITEILRLREQARK